MNDVSLPSSKAELLARVQAERAALEQAIANSSEAQLTAPGPEGWSAKDHLAHVVTWEQILVLAHLQGRSFAEAAHMDEATAAATAHMTAETGLNAYFHQRDKDRSLAEVLADFHRSYRRLLSVLEEMDFASLLAPRDPDDPHGQPLIHVVIGDTYAHYREHRRIIQALITSRT